MNKKILIVIVIVVILIIVISVSQAKAGTGGGLADEVKMKFLKLTEKLGMEYPKDKIKMLEKTLKKKKAGELEKMNEKLNALLSKSKEDAEKGLEEFLLDYLS